jgi:ribonuclease E
MAEPHSPRSAAPVETPPPDNTAHDNAASRRRHETGSSEPRIERVVVSPDQAAEGSGDGTAAPQRKGWWQRRFGSE